jgi:hypothetical protein
MAEGSIDDILFEDRLERKIRDCYHSPDEKTEGSYAIVSRTIADALRNENRYVSEGLILVEAYSALAEDRLSVEEVGDLVVSTILEMGESGLTADMAVNIMEKYLKYSDGRADSPQDFVSITNSALGIIKVTYQNVGFVKGLISIYGDWLKKDEPVAEIGKAVNKTLLALGRSRCKIADIEKVAGAYDMYAKPGYSVSELCDVMCDTLTFMRDKSLSAKEVVAEIRKAAGPHNIITIDEISGRVMRY